VKVRGHAKTQGIDFFGYWGSDYYGISEVITGMSIAKEDTRKLAIDVAREQLILNATTFHSTLARQTPVMELPLHPYELFDE
jgi:hypothetical protein